MCNLLYYYIESRKGGKPFVCEVVGISVLKRGRELFVYELCVVGICQCTLMEKFSHIEDETTPALRRPSCRVSLRVLFPEMTFRLEKIYSARLAKQVVHLS